MNETLDYIVNGTYGKVYDCGTMITQWNDKVTGMVKAVSIVMIVLIIFEWWAVNKVMNGKLTHDRKQLYISFIFIFIHSLIMLGAFYIMYWLVLSGVDF